jgi:small subunit ribosomal protein S1
VFVELEPELEGLLHVSELADHKVENPQDEVQIGQDLDVKILRVDTIERKIGLSKKRAEWATEPEAEADADRKRDKRSQRRGGLGHDTFGDDLSSLMHRPFEPDGAQASEAAPEPPAESPPESGGEAPTEPKEPTEE